MRRLAASLVAIALLLLGGAERARAQDEPRWGETVVVPAGGQRDGDATALGAPLIVDGELAGDAVAVRGDVVVRGRVRGDAVALAGRVVVEGPGAEVAGNAFAACGGVTTREGGRVAGVTRVVAPLDDGETPGYLNVAWSTPGFLARLLATVFWVLSALVAALVAPGAVIAASEALGRSRARLLGIGLLVHVAAVLAALLFTALVVVFVGIPLLLLLALLWAALQAVALAAVFHALGEAIAERLRAPVVSAYARVLLGALAASLLLFVPVLGETAFVLVCLLGAGAVVVTRAP